MDEIQGDPRRARVTRPERDGEDDGGRRSEGWKKGRFADDGKENERRGYIWSKECRIKVALRNRLSERSR